MLIRINLHPERGTRRRLALPTSGASLAKIAAPVRDKYLLGAIVAVVVACGGVAALHVTQSREAQTLADQEATAVRDSTRYAAVIAARTKALARRDSLARELRVIAAIDSTRYTWAHLLDEVSRTLPPYTWLTAVSQTSAPPAPPSLAVKSDAKGAKAAPNAKPAPAKAGADSAAGPLKFRLVGQTVDLQALTLFMRDLEASPFVRNVQLAHSEPVQGGVQGTGREVTEFTLDAEFETPARDVLRTVAITVPVR